MNSLSLFSVAFLVTIMALITSSSSSVISAQESFLTVINLTYCSEPTCTANCLPLVVTQNDCVPTVGGGHAIAKCNYGDDGSNTPVRQFSTFFYGILTVANNDCAAGVDDPFTNTSLQCGSCYSPNGDDWFNVTCDSQNGDAIFTPIIHGFQQGLCDGTGGTPIRAKQGNCTTLGATGHHFKLMSGPGGFQAEGATIRSFKDGTCFEPASYLVVPTNICGSLGGGIPGSAACPEPTPAPPTTSSTTTRTSTTTSTTTTMPPSTTSGAPTSSTTGAPGVSTSSTTATSTMTPAPTTSSSTTTTPTPTTTITSSSTAAPTTSTNPPTTSSTTMMTMSSTSASATQQPSPTTPVPSTTMTTSAVPTTTPAPNVPTTTMLPNDYNNCTTTSISFNNGKASFKPYTVLTSDLKNMVSSPGNVNSIFRISLCNFAKPGDGIAGCTSTVNQYHSAFITQYDNIGEKCILQASMLVEPWAYDSTTSSSSSSPKFTARYRSLLQKTDLFLNVYCTKADDAKLYAKSTTYNVRKESDWTYMTLELATNGACNDQITPAPPPSTPSPNGNNNGNNNGPNNNNNDKGTSSSKLAIYIGAGAGALGVLIGVVCFFYTRGKDKRSISQKFDPSFPDDRSLYPTNTGSQANSTSNMNQQRPSSSAANDIEEPLNADDHAA